MNGWTQEELDRIEREAMKLPSVDAMANHLHVLTGLGMSVCESWARDISAKRDRVGD
jgi:hypothetical protein